MDNSNRSSNQLIIGKGIPTVLNKLNITGSHLMTQLEPSKIVITLRPKKKWCNSSKTFPYTIHTRTDNNGKYIITSAISNFKAETGSNNLPQLIDKPNNNLNEASQGPVNKLSTTSLKKLIESTSCELKATRSLTDILRLSAGGADDSSKLLDDPRRKVGFLQPPNRIVEEPQESRQSRQTKTSEKSKKMKKSQKSQKSQKSKKSDKSKQSEQPNNESVKSDEITPQHKFELVACISEEMMNEVKKPQTFRRNKQHPHKSIKPCKRERIDYTKPPDNLPMQPDNMKGLRYSLQKPIEVNFKAQASSVKACKEKCCRIDNLEKQMYLLSVELEHVKKEHLPPTQTSRIDKLNYKLLELNSFLSDFRHKCFKKKNNQNSEPDEVEEQLENIENLQALPPNAQNDVENCSHVKSKQKGFSETANVSIRHRSVSEGPPITSAKPAKRSEPCIIGPLPDAVLKYDQIKIVNDYRVDPELRRARLEKKCHKQLKKSSNSNNGPEDEYPEIKICEEYEENGNNNNYNTRKQDNKNMQYQKAENRKDGKNLKCEQIEWDTTPISPVEDNYFERAEAGTETEGKRRKWRLLRKKKSKSPRCSIDEKEGASQPTKVNGNFEPTLELPRCSNYKRKSAISTNTRPVGCNMCANIDVPLFTKNLYEGLLERINGLKPSSIALTILLQGNNLYHINLATLHTGQSLGCIFATEQCIVEANKAHVFEKFLTFFVVDSLNTMEEKNIIVNHSFDFIRN